MSDPEQGDDNPLVDRFAEGEYWWCSCGRSKELPFCDGSHKGTEFSPVQIIVDKEQKLALCLCGLTENPPFCDGSHAKPGKKRER